MHIHHSVSADLLKQASRASLILIVIILIAGCRGSAVSEDPVGPRDAQWREDLAHLVDRMNEIHPDLYHTVDRSVFEQARARLDSEIPSLSDDQIFVEFLRLVALPATERDGHMALSFFEGTGFQIVPIQLFRFSDGVFVVDTAPTYSQFLGMKLLGIGEFTLEEVNRLIDPLIPRDNENSLTAFRNLVYITPQILEVLGIIEDAGAPMYRFESVSMALDPVPPNQYGLESIYNLPTPSSPPLYLTRRNENFWLEYLQAEGILYLRLNAVQPTSGSEDLDEFGQRVLALIDGGGIERVILDLRQNNGGNNQLIPGILDFLTDDRIDRREGLFVFTDRNTFSAAGNLVAAIALETSAQFVGVSPGGSGSQYGDAERVDLPNSRFAAFIPSRHWIFGAPGDQLLMHPMDIIIEPTGREFLDGFDPLLALYTGG